MENSHNFKGVLEYTKGYADGLKGIFIIDAGNLEFQWAYYIGHTDAVTGVFYRHIDEWIKDKP